MEMLRNWRYYAWRKVNQYDATERSHLFVDLIGCTKITGYKAQEGSYLKTNLPVSYSISGYGLSPEPKPVLGGRPHLLSASCGPGTHSVW